MRTTDNTIPGVSGPWTGTADSGDDARTLVGCLLDAYEQREAMEDVAAGLRAPLAYDPDAVETRAATPLALVQELLDRAAWGAL